MKTLRPYKKHIKKYIKTSHNKYLQTKKNRKKTLFKIKKHCCINLITYCHQIHRTLLLDTKILQAKINNLKKLLKTIYLFIKIILFLSLTYYKTIQTNREKNNILEQHSISISTIKTIQTPVVKKYSSRFIQEAHYTNHS